MLAEPLQLFLLTGERFTVDGSPEGEPMDPTPEEWTFPVKGTGLRGVFRVELGQIPEDGPPKPLVAT